VRRDAIRNRSAGVPAMNAWVAWYGALLWAHVATVSLSVAVFVLRGLAVQCGAAWPLRRAVRAASVVIDTLLLCAGAGLWVLMQHNPLREPWLGIKLLILPLYIVCGAFALKRARTPAGRRLFFGLALACVLAIVTLAVRRSVF